MITMPKFDLTGAKKWRGVVLHHSATRDSQTNDWESIRKFHTSYRYEGNPITEEAARALVTAGKKGVLAPWSDIGYHFGIEDEDGQTIIKTGRAMSLAGGHAKEFNVTHLGICVVGNFDEQPPTMAKWMAALELVRSLMRYFPFTAKEVLGHRETYPLRGVPVEKTCPGRKWELDDFRAQV